MVWGSTDSAGETHTKLNFSPKSKHKFEQVSRKKTYKKAKIKPVSLRSGKTLRTDIQKIREKILGDKVPVIMALLMEYPYRLRMAKNPIKHCFSQINNALPCEELCRRIQLNPCASYCRKCDKKSSTVSRKPKR